MVLLVASRFDEQAFHLAKRWVEQDARVLTARDLSRVGWVYSPEFPDTWRGVLGDEYFDASNLTGVLNCLPEVNEQELGHIAPEDRAYVAAEMNAFLVSWQSQLGCLVINRPTPSCLVGPAWRIEEWLLTATRLNIPVLGIQHRSQRKSLSFSQRVQDMHPVTVIDELSLGGSEELGKRAQRLARAAGVTLATFYFGSSVDAELVAVSLGADLEQQAVADALLGHFSEVRRQC
jgi:hypothetical protein